MKIIFTYRSKRLVETIHYSLYQNDDGVLYIATQGEGEFHKIIDQDYQSVSAMREYWNFCGLQEITDYFVNENGELCQTNKPTIKHPCTCNSHELFLKGCQCGGI